MWHEGQGYNWDWCLGSPSRSNQSELLANNNGGNVPARDIVASSPALFQSRSCSSAVQMLLGAPRWKYEAWPRLSQLIPEIKLHTDGILSRGLILFPDAREVFVWEDSWTIPFN